MAKSGTANFYNGVATQSLRFDDGSSAFLSRTPAGASNQKTWTFSAWIKPSNITDSSGGAIFTRHDSGSNTFVFRLDQNDDLQVENYTSGAYQLHLVTDAKFRDISAWYHVVLSLDTTQGTAANRAKLYVNGVQQTSLSASTYPSENADLKVNAAAVHRIGARSSNNYFDGYMAEVNFVDGTQLAPTSFGETKNGVWIPIDTSGLTFGTNGFRLDFADNAVDAPTSEGTEDTDNIGSDSSGEHNNWTSSGIVASDCAMPDSPENNFCVMGSSTMKRYGHVNNATMAEGGLKSTAGDHTHTFGTMSIKQILANGLGVYFEMRFTTASTNASFYGIVAGQENNAAIGTGVASYQFPLKFVIDFRGYINGGTQTDGTNETNIGAGALSGDYRSIFTVAAGDVMGLAIKSDGKVFISKNGTFVNSLAGTSNPATGANPIHVIDTTLDWFPYNGYYPDTVWHANFGQDGSFSGSETSGGETDSNGIGDFFSAVPSGFVCLSTLNIAEPTIGPNSDTQADDHFNTVLYTGNATDRSISGVGFQPDWVWGSKRSATGGSWLFDSTRGATKQIASFINHAESTQATMLTSFDSDGFSMGTDGAGNANTATFVAWNWKANGGTATATISESGDNPAAVVQANPTAGFSLITYTGTGDAGTIAHGLGAVPTMMIIKNRDVADSWAVYHGANTAAPATDYLVLDTSAATADDSGHWNDTAPTDSVFTVHDNHTVNADGEKYVAYVFANIEGYSKMGSYIGNSNADGTFVYLGFRPAWIMIKSTDAQGWQIYDTKRNVSNPSPLILFPSTNGAEQDDASAAVIDMLSNGFKQRVNDGGANGAGTIYIYMAFAEVPFKYANAR